VTTRSEAYDELTRHLLPREDVAIAAISPKTFSEVLDQLIQAGGFVQRDGVVMRFDGPWVNYSGKGEDYYSIRLRPLLWRAVMLSAWPVFGQTRLALNYSPSIHPMLIRPADGVPDAPEEGGVNA
jgi:hypothetical protein